MMQFESLRGDSQKLMTILLWRTPYFFSSSYPPNHTTTFYHLYTSPSQPTGPLDHTSNIPTTIHNDQHILNRLNPAPTPSLSQNPSLSQQPCVMPCWLSTYRALIRFCSIGRPHVPTDTATFPNMATHLPYMASHLPYKEIPSMLSHYHRCLCHHHNLAYVITTTSLTVTSVTCHISHISHTYLRSNSAWHVTRDVTLSQPL